jgi:hypothetical protein
MSGETGGELSNFRMNCCAVVTLWTMVVTVLNMIYAFKQSMVRRLAWGKKDGEKSTLGDNWSIVVTEEDQEVPIKTFYGARPFHVTLLLILLVFLVLVVGIIIN